MGDFRDSNNMQRSANDHTATVVQELSPDILMYNVRHTFVYTDDHILKPSHKEPDKKTFQEECDI
jgi:hypothetical protein